ncbi:wax ester/triacylglycerol synthase family O-acyltransferase [Rubrivirga sp. IMCC45206]|uniref:wax ester/triacylglycerol synthase family O-acyltransferase n=1 Tax=Rubrivirga sp. IMCC45206 TaxID=3391614 RepID=UPI0039900FA8
MDTPRPFVVTPPDSAWLRMESPTNPMTITGIFGVEGRLSLDDLRAFVGDRLVRFDRFRMRIEGAGSSRPRWVPDDFDLDRHVFEADLPAPGGKAGLQTLVSRLMSEPLSFAHSPWTFHLVHDVDHGDGTVGSAVVVRIHHVIGDGIALMHVMIHAVDEYFADDAPAVRPRKRAKPALGARVAQTLKGAGAETADLLLHPSHLGRRLKGVGGITASLGHLLAMRPDSETVFKGHASIDKRAAWTDPIPLDLLKGIGEAMDAKVNDVVMATAAGALRRFLAEAGESVDDVTVRVAAPFNVRPLDRAHELGNSFGLVFVALPIGEPTAAGRLRVTKERMDAVKRSKEPAVVFGILQSIGRAPMWVHRQVVNIFEQKASGVLTNVPGPQETLHIMGAPIRTIMFWVPQAGDIGMGISVISLDGSIRVGVTTDAAYVAEPARLAQAFADEIAALADEFGVPVPSE